MKALYKNKLYYVIETEGDNVQLRSGDTVITVPLSDPDLIIEPTDDEASTPDQSL